MTAVPAIESANCPTDQAADHCQDEGHDDGGEHHRDDRCRGDLVHCEQVTLLLPHLGVRHDAVGGAIAQNLTAGLSFDTANFAHSNTSPRTLRAASELVAAGAELPMIARRIYRTKPTAQLKLFGRVLSRLETSADGRLIWSVVSLADFEAAGATQQMSEGLIDLLAQSASAEVAILFKDLGEVVRLSIRTRDDGVDATKLAGAFGGGGHARAAGASYDGAIDAADRAVNEQINL